jgi:SAM-dependent methyltransferase
LNVGAATGRSTEILQPYGKVDSVEYDEPSYRFCKEVLGIDVVRASITELPFPDASYDIVCCFDVIEHVEDDAKAVEELIRVCRPGGAVFLTVPAYMSLWSDHDKVNRHFRRYVKGGLAALFAVHGGQTVRFTYFNSLLFPPIWMVRRLQRIFKGKDGETARPDNEFMQNPFTDRLFGTVFGWERRLLRHMDFPFGVSLMMVWRKSA